MEEALRAKLEGPSNTDGSDGVYARAISLQLRDVALPGGAPCVLVMRPTSPAPHM